MLYKKLVDTIETTIKADIVNYMKSHQLLEIKFNRPFKVQVEVGNTYDEEYNVETQLATTLIHDGSVVTNQDEILNTVDIYQRAYIMDILESNQYEIVDKISILDH